MQLKDATLNSDFLPLWFVSKTKEESTLVASSNTQMARKFLLHLLDPKCGPAHPCCDHHPTMWMARECLLPFCPEETFEQSYSWFWCQDQGQTMHAPTHSQCKRNSSLSYHRTSIQQSQLHSRNCLAIANVAVHTPHELPTATTGREWKTKKFQTICSGCFEPINCAMGKFSMFGTGHVVRRRPLMNAGRMSHGGVVSMMHFAAVPIAARIWRWKAKNMWIQPLKQQTPFFDSMLAASKAPFDYLHVGEWSHFLVW